MRERCHLSERSQVFHVAKFPFLEASGGTVSKQTSPPKALSQCPLPLPHGITFAGDGVVFANAPHSIK